MAAKSPTRPRYRVQFWPHSAPVYAPVVAVMPWAVVHQRRASLPIEARCYTRYRALLICKALNRADRRS